MKYQNFFIALTIVAIIASAFSSTFSTTSYTASHNLNMWTSAVEAIVIRTDGSIEKLYMGPNNITNVGLNWTRDFLAWSGKSSGQATAIVLGNGSTAEDPTITTLSNQFNATCCGLTPQAGTVTNQAATGGSQNSGNYSTTYQWTVSGCSGGNITVNTTALYNNSAPGNSCGAGCVMFAGKNFSAPVTLQNGDQLNVTWYVWAASGG